METSLVDTDQETDSSSDDESPEQEQEQPREQDSGHQNLERKSSFFQFFVQKNYSLSSSNLFSCLQIIISIMTGMLLVLGTMSMTCYSHLKFIPRLVHVNNISELPNNSPANAICKTLHNAFVGGSSSSSSSHNGRETLNEMLLQGFVIPLFVASVLSSIACILARQEERKSSNSSNNQVPGGRFHSLFNKRDPPLTFFTVLLMLMPSLYIAFETQLYPSRSEGSSFYITLFGRLANPAGVAACFALSLFLIPVAKHSPLIEVFGLSFTQALSFHRISGWTSLVFSLIHGGLYILMYGIGDDKKGFWAKAIPALYPPQRCWGWDIFSVHGQSTSGCYGYWRNFTGVISLLAFVLLGITSLPAIRRRAYWLFISVHIPAAWVMMIGAIAHFRIIALFLLPNIVYYLVTTVPVWIQHTTVPVWIQRVRNARFDQGPNVKSITLIDDSNGCCLLKLRCPESQPHTDVSLDNYGGVCRICVPEISSIWHPFSVTLTSQGTRELSILMRPVGHFTQALLGRFLPIAGLREENLDSSSSPPRPDVELMDDENPTSNTLTPIFLPTPTVLVDGVYPAEYRWLRNILHHHDSVLLVAGGVGIVPFLTFLPGLIEELTMNYNHTSNKTPLCHLALHWYCREEGLAKFVCQHYQLASLFDPSIVNIHNPLNVEVEEDRTRNIRLQLFVHITSRQAGNNDLSTFLGDIQNVCNNDLLQENVIVDAESGTISSSRDQQLSSRSTTFTFKYPAGKRLWTEAFMSTNYKIWQKFFIFILSLGSSMGLHWLYYTKGTAAGTSTIAHAYPVFCVSLITLLLGVVLYVLERCNCNSGLRGFESILEQDIDEEDSGISRSIDEASRQFCTDPSPPAGESTQQNENCTSISRQLVVSAGRPRMEEVIGPLINAHVPGAFFCGPETLRTRVKQSIKKKRREIHGSFSMPCAFYDENSDM
eukprot:CAMPEP_0194104814 /NCGR_PEP_ID=MMETSP0150-20130528/5097_1 /TAXON_ID=122233 /ORGANISM="Chaetoceros debilis, Strain MM31A-1" /LENGTH=938 /DNA_ID=CAMNT_0038792465 /DNA_START=80 /DNA_END=2896 /DNA_ORIENTATION=-